MKKISLVILISLFTGLAYAQSTDRSLRFGIKGGANFSNIIKDDGNNNFNTDMLTGFHAGITLDIPLLPALAFTPEAVYSTKGYKQSSTFGDFTQTTHFVEIPILASIEVAKGFNLVAGPQVSFLLSTQQKFESGFGTVEREIVEDDADRFKKSLVGGVIGVRFDLNRQLGINGRYALDFQKNNTNGSSQTPVFKNQVFQVGLGLKL